MTRLSVRLGENPCSVNIHLQKFLQIHFLSAFSVAFPPLSPSCLLQRPVLIAPQYRDGGAPLGLLITSCPSCAGVRSWAGFTSAHCTVLHPHKDSESHNRPGLIGFFKGLQGNMENSMSRFIYDLGFLLLHPTPQMLHALNSVSGSLWHFQPQPQQRGMWRSSWGLDPALPLHPAELLTTPVEPSSAETQLV